MNECVFMCMCVLVIYSYWCHDGIVVRYYDTNAQGGSILGYAHAISICNKACN